MSRRQFAVMIVGAALVVAGCSSGGSSASAASRACRQTTEAGVVKVSIKDFAFKPSAIIAKVGQVISFTNTGFEPHTATLDAGGCTTPTLDTDKCDGLVFSAAGIFPFHCTVHAQMTGTITIGG